MLRTPGPWEVEDDTVVVGQDGMKRVADCGQEEWLLDGEGEANALLIAAAPDLLAALDDLVSVCVRITGDGNPGFDPAVAKAKTALHKAGTKPRALSESG